MPHHAATKSDRKADAKPASAQQSGSNLNFEEWDDCLAVTHEPMLNGITPRQVMALQRVVGNHAVQRMLEQQNTAAVKRDESSADTLSTASSRVGPQAGSEVEPRSNPPSATIQRTPAPKISSFASSAGASLIQRRTVLASKPGHFHMIPGSPKGDAKQKIRQISKAKRAKKYNRFDDIEVSDHTSKHITDGTGQVVWYHVSRANGVTDNRQYVLAEKILASFSGAPTSQEVKDSDPELDTVSKTDNLESTGGIVNEVDNALVDVLRGYTLKEDLQGEELTSGETKIQTEGNIAEGAFWAGGGAFGMVSGILGMAASLKDLTSNEKTTWEKVEAAFNLIASGSDYLGGSQGIVGGVSQIVNSQQEEGTAASDLSSGVASWALGFQGMFTSLTNGIKTILDVVSLIRMIVRQVSDKETFDRDEWLAKAGSLLMNALETAKGVITTFRVMWELVNSTVTGAFEAVVPGFDIAIAAIKSIFQGYYLAKSAFHWFQMAKSGREAKKNLKQQGFGKDKIKEAQKFYGKREGLISNTENRIGKNEKGIAKRRRKLAKARAKAPSKYEFIRNRNLKQQNKLGLEINSRKLENRDVTSRKNVAMKEITDYESNTIDSSGSMMPLPDSGSSGTDDSNPVSVSSPPVQNPSRLQLSELNLTKELSSANSKRVTRQAIHIGTNLVKIAGSIVTIVAGTGAPAGVALKAAAAGVDISLPFFRSLKQFGRNKAGKAQAKGKKNLFTKVFNPNKSNIAKLQHRKRQAVTILLMVADLNNLLPTSKSKKRRNQQRTALTKRVTHVERYMYAAGVSPKKLYRANGKPAEQIKLLVEAMCKREFF